MGADDTGSDRPAVGVKSEHSLHGGDAVGHPEEPFHVHAGEHQRFDRRAVQHVVFDPVGGSASIVISQLNHRQI